MKEKLNEILKSNDEHLSEKDLFGYMSHQLSLQEVRRVEVHLSECELCSDALDGVMQSSNPEHAHAQLASLRNAIHKKYRGNEVRNMFPFTRALAIAATVILLAVSAWFVEYVLNNDSQKIFTDRFEPYPAPPTVNEPQVAAPVASDAEEKQEIKSVPPSKNKKEVDVATGKSVEQFDNAVVAQDESVEAIPSAPEVESAPQSLNEVVTSKAEQPAKSIKDNAQYDSKKQNDDAALKTQSKAAVAQTESFNTLSNVDYGVMQEDIQHLNNGMQFYKDNQFSEAIKEFGFVLKNDPNHSQANFYSGVSALAMNNVDDALRYLKKTDSKGNQYYEASLWYQALANVKKENKKEAEKLLQKVIELNGEYKSKADELMKQL